MPCKPVHLYLFSRFVESSEASQNFILAGVGWGWEVEYVRSASRRGKGKLHLQMLQILGQKGHAASYVNTLLLLPQAWGGQGQGCTREMGGRAGRPGRGLGWDLRRAF